jgi:hypothetical protein
MYVIAISVYVHMPFCLNSCLLNFFGVFSVAFQEFLAGNAIIKRDTINHSPCHCSPALLEFSCVSFVTPDRYIVT